ncbi:ribosomal protein s18 [Phlyctema vagabunda]|uniref:Small ribosomal subunit protein bS18m n=1 Tax=Phlyctema vagabunda TaxID=108571 RepID=A0ABR4PLQ5_9HELO
MERLLQGFKRGPREDRTPGQPSSETVDQLKQNKLGQDLSKQISRRWRAGDVYAPHDLSAVEMAKWKRKLRPEYDIFDTLDLNPLKEYKNFSMLSEYMSPMGRILPRSETGLRPVNQRRISKAIRRAIGMGLMPSVHKHPELLQKSIQRAAQVSPITRGPIM